jgi:hypothetical protein
MPAPLCVCETIRPGIIVSQNACSVPSTSVGLPANAVEGRAIRSAIGIALRTTAPAEREPARDRSSRLDIPLP